MGEDAFDVAVIGAGFGGVYAAHRLSREGHSVVGIDGASGFGGTWYHNGYPGSRVDTDSIDAAASRPAAHQMFMRMPWLPWNRPVAAGRLSQRLRPMPPASFADRRTRGLAADGRPAVHLRASTQQA